MSIFFYFTSTIQFYSNNTIVYFLDDYYEIYCIRVFRLCYNSFLTFVWILVSNRDSYKEPSSHVATERYSPVRRASEGSGAPGPAIQAIQQEYQQLQRLASPSHSPASIPGSPVHERSVAAITQGINFFLRKDVVFSRNQLFFSKIYSFLNIDRFLRLFCI